MVIQRFRPHFSGQGVQLEQVCRHLAERGVGCDVLTAVRGIADETEAVGEQMTVRRLRCDLLPGSGERNGLWMPTFAARVALALWRRRRRIDLVHVHGATDAIVGAWAFCRLTRKPLVLHMTLLGDDDPRTLLQRRQRLARLRRRAYRNADAYVAMSPAFLPSSRQAGIPPERLTIIPQGFDARRFRPPSAAERMAARAALGVPADAAVIAFVGSLIERKGLDLLCRAWADLAVRHPHARLLLVGRDAFPPGSAEERFLAAQMRLLPHAAVDRLVRTGPRDEVERMLWAADAFCLPSRREGFGSVIVEAMATALPCVVTELPGITDWIFARPARRPFAGADGLVVPPRAEAIGGALDALLSCPGAARSLGERARARALARFEFTHVIEQYLRLYERLLEPAA